MATAAQPHRLNSAWLTPGIAVKWHFRLRRKEENSGKRFTIARKVIYVSRKLAVEFPPGSALSSVGFDSLPGNTGGDMGVSEILASIDREIALLQQARAVLGGDSAAAPGKRRGRPRKAAGAATKPAKKRHLSPEGRRRIAEAVRRRWAEQRKASSSAK